MDFEGFQWDEGNSAKCRKHGVTRLEIEDLFSRDVLVIEDRANSQAEQRFRAIGVSSGARHIFVVFTLRDGLLRPLSARYMHAKEIRRYEKDNPDIHDR